MVPQAGRRGRERWALLSRVRSEGPHSLPHGSRTPGQESGLVSASGAPSARWRKSLSGRL